MESLTCLAYNGQKCPNDCKQQQQQQRAFDQYGIQFENRDD